MYNPGKALADFLNAPDIDEIDISGYDGSKGGRLLVKVVDDYMVAEVKLPYIRLMALW